MMSKQQSKKNSFKGSVLKALKLELALVAIASLFLASCQTDGTLTDVNGTTAPISVVTATTQTEADAVSDGVSNVVEQVYLEEENPAVLTQTAKGAVNKTTNNYRFLPDCVTITKVITDSTKVVTIDFGDGDCEMPNGNVLSGKIIMRYKIDTNEQSKTINYSFDNFYFNGKHVEGAKTIVRVRENENGNPQSTINLNLTITFPDGDVATMTGEKVREWIEGQDTPAWGDNVYLITGHWSVTNKNGQTHSVTVLEPLRRELSCRFFVSGIIELHRGDRVATINFGDGECDDLAIVTINGEDHEIHLGKNHNS